MEDYYDKDDLSEDEWAAFQTALQDKYTFYVLNPDWTPGVSYALWIDEGEYEYPILNSNTGGFVTVNSRHKEIGDGIEPTEAFLSLVGFGFHEAMCFMPDLYFDNGQFEESIDMWYDGKPREYEVWAAEYLIHECVTPGISIPEFEPFVQYAAKHSEFGCPALSGDA